MISHLWLLLFALCCCQSISFCTAKLPLRHLTGIRGGNRRLTTRPTASGLLASIVTPPPSDEHAAMHSSELLSEPPAKKPWWSVLRLFTHTETFFSVLLTVLVEDEDFRKVLAKILSYSFWGFLALSVLGTLGLDTKPILSLVSVLGITLGFAAKDLLSHAFSGLLLMLTRPFERGDVIVVNGLRGRVLAMDVRFVRLQALGPEGHEILLPIASIAASAIVIERGG